MLCIFNHRYRVSLVQDIFDRKIQGVSGLGYIESQDTGYWILDTGYWILDTGYWILDTGYQILDTGY